jgi:tRNA(Leu) C34 or U34 (ribose-2'-O)-methylase TrmL
MSRILYKPGTWVILIKTGQRFQVEIDYEDHVYLFGKAKEVLPEEIRLA